MPLTYKREKIEFVAEIPEPIIAALTHNDMFFIVSAYGVYRMHDNGNVERIISALRITKKKK